MVPMLAKLVWAKFGNLSIIYVKVKPMHSITSILIETTVVIIRGKLIKPLITRLDIS